MLLVALSASRTALQGGGASRDSRATPKLILVGKRSDRPSTRLVTVV